MMEVLYEDYLERCINTGNKKEYKKAYFVFRQNTAGSKTLEYFKDTNWRKSEPRGVCNLFNGYSVRVLNLNETKKKFGIELKTVGKTFELHASSDQLREKWIEVLNKDLETFYSATLLESPPNAYSFVKLLNGQLHLQITDCSVILLANRVPSITWRFGTIRRYKSKDGAFVLEVGRKSSTGEGIFRFQVPDPNKLFDDLDKALKQRIELKRNQDSSFESHRTSSFDENINNRRSVNIRSPSIEDNRLTSSPPGYSSLDHIPINKPIVYEVNGYDKLFGERVGNLTPPHSSTPALFNNTRIIGRNLSTKNDLNDDDNSTENYIDMSGMKDEIINESKNVTKYPETKPRPAPRVPRTSGTPPVTSGTPPVSSSPSGNTDLNNRIGPLSSGDVDLIDLNTYDCPSTQDLSNSPGDRNVSEYHVLNKHTPPKSVNTTPGYDHLSNMYANKVSQPVVSNTTNNFNENSSIYRNSIDDIYDSPKLHSNDKKTNDCQQIKSNVDTGKKPPPPIPCRPQPPVRRPRRGSDRINSCDSLPDTVLVLGKSSTQISKGSNSSETLYDSPRGNLQNEFVNTRKAHSLNADAFLHMNQGLSEVYQVPRTEGF